MLICMHGLYGIYYSARFFFEWMKPKNPEFQHCTWRIVEGLVCVWRCKHTSSGHFGWGGVLVRWLVSQWWYSSSPWWEYIFTWALKGSLMSFVYWLPHVNTKLAEDEMVEERQIQRRIRERKLLLLAQISCLTVTKAETMGRLIWKLYGQHSA